MDHLEAIWNRVARQAKDGKKYIVFKNAYDLAFLYASGFVDSKKFTYQDWLSAFAPSKIKEGAYLVTHQQWSEKKKFHYSGPVGTPFDPMSLTEKTYPEADFTQILKEKVLPETIFNDTQILTFVNNLKAQGRIVNGQVRIDAEAKKFMLQFMNTYPSPMRVLRIQVQRMKTAKVGALKSVQQQANESGFAVGKTAQQITASRLADLSNTSANTLAKTPVPEKEMGAGKTAVSLKDLQKKRPGQSRV